MPVYQDASEIRDARVADLEDAARAALGEMSDSGLLPNLAANLMIEYTKQLETMLLAILVMHQRTEQYGVGSWRAIGWKGHLLRVWDKAVRLMNGYWWGITIPDEKGLDNAVDLINHVTFMARAMDDGNENGAAFR